MGFTPTQVAGNSVSDIRDIYRNVARGAWMQALKVSLEVAPFKTVAYLSGVGLTASVVYFLILVPIRHARWAVRVLL